MGLIILLLSLWKWVGFNHFIAIAVEVGWVWSFNCYRCGSVWFGHFNCNRCGSELGLVILLLLLWKWVGLGHFNCNRCGSGLGLAILLQSLWKWVGFNHFIAIAVEVCWVWSFNCYRCGSVWFGHFTAIAMEVFGLVILTAIAVEVGWVWSFLPQLLWKWVGFNHFTAIAVEVGWV